MKKINFLLIVFTIASILSSCKFVGNCQIKGKGPIVEKKINVTNFHSLKSNGDFNIVLKQGEGFEVIVKSHENVIELLDTQIVEGVWNIKLNENVYFDGDITIFITMPTLKMLKINGSGDVTASTFNNIADLELVINGSGNIKFDSLIAQSLSSEINGSGDIQISGNVPIQTISIAGSGDYNSEKCDSKDVSVKIAGSGDVKVTATDNLNVKIAGSGDVYYKGKPQTNFKVSGSGEVIAN